MGAISKVVVLLVRSAAAVPIPLWLDTMAAPAAVRTMGAYKRHLSGHTGRRCLFCVTCSEHAAQSISLNGLSMGLKDAVVRLNRCGGSYTIAIDIFGSPTLTTADGMRFSAGELAPWLHSDRQNERLLEAPMR
jgi:putative component of membrane protein insertase Oxa1/YidC/SpoIIIJ protein YidD